jgi:hypothetical protein
MRIGQKGVLIYEQLAQSKFSQGHIGQLRQRHHRRHEFLKVLRAGMFSVLPRVWSADACYYVLFFLQQKGSDMEQIGYRDLLRFKTPKANAVYKENRSNIKQ